MDKDEFFKTIEDVIYFPEEEMEMKLQTQNLLLHVSNACNKDSVSKINESHEESEKHNKFSLEANAIKHYE